MGSRKIRLTKRVYIERSDYFRLAPGKTAGLLHIPYPVKAVSFEKYEPTEAVKEIRAVYDRDGKKSKTSIHWVPEGSLTAEVRVYAPLFRSDDPKVAPGGFKEDINPHSETIWSNALVEEGFQEVRRRAPWPSVEGDKAVEGP